MGGGSVAKFDIVVASAGQHVGWADRCTHSINQHSHDYRFIWIADGYEEFSPVAIHFPERVGLPKALNAGLAISTAPYVVLLNDDVEVVEGWLENMCFWFGSCAHPVGIVSTCVDHDGSAVSARGLGAPINQAAFKNIIPFYCIMLSRECIEKVGYFDERFRYGFGFDNDYCERVRKAGFSIAVDLRTVVKHGHRTTSKILYGDKMAEHQREAEKLLREKWGR
jgi:hypothetical protein